MTSEAFDRAPLHLPAAVQTRLDANGGVSSARELADVGADRLTVAAFVRTGTLVRVRRDAVVDGRVWREATPTQRHALRGRAVLRSLDPTGTGPYALSHHSALAVQGIPVFGGDERVHLVRTDGQRGHVSPTTHGHPPVHQSLVHVVNGMRVVRPAKAALQVASRAGVEAGLVSADAALHSGAATPEELEEALRDGGYGHGIRHVRLVAKLADGRIESPGESRLRWLLRALGYLDAVPQALIVDDGGDVVARVDFLFEAQRVVVEFDGRLKYERSQDLWNEKQREDRIRRLGYVVVRVTWADLAKPQRVRALLLQAFARSAARDSATS
jgi:hypothetical protein